MDEKFKREKYGYEHQARVSFQKVLRLSIALKDFDIVDEIWEKMQDEGKKLWQDSPKNTRASRFYWKNISNLLPTA